MRHVLHSACLLVVSALVACSSGGSSASTGTGCVAPPTGAIAQGPLQGTMYGVPFVAGTARVQVDGKGKASIFITSTVGDPCGSRSVAEGEHYLRIEDVSWASSNYTIDSCTRQSGAPRVSVNKQDGGYHSEEASALVELAGVTATGGVIRVHAKASGNSDVAGQIEAIVCR